MPTGIFLPGMALRVLAEGERGEQDVGTQDLRQQTTAWIVKKLRSMIAARGMLRTTEGLERVFGDMDTDGSKELDFGELSAGLQNCGIALPRKERKMLFEVLDVDNSGTISTEEFVFAVMPPLPKQRLDIVNGIFSSLASSLAAEEVNINIIYQHCQFDNHPSVRRGNMSSQEAFIGFLSSFASAHGISGVNQTLTRQSFIRYCSVISHDCDTIQEFARTMKNSFGIRDEKLKQFMPQTQSLKSKRKQQMREREIALRRDTERNLSRGSQSLRESTHGALGYRGAMGRLKADYQFYFDR